MHDDEGDEEMNEGHPCPICGESDECEHQLVLVPWAEGEIFGELADEVDEMGEQLVDAIWDVASRDGGVGEIVKSQASAALKAIVLDEEFEPNLDREDPDGCDWARLIWRFWIAVATASGGVHHTWRVDDVWPATTEMEETVDAVYGAEPGRIIKASKAAARMDMRILERLAERMEGD